jgi:hypothetical protein
MVNGGKQLLIQIHRCKILTNCCPFENGILTIKESSELVSDLNSINISKEDSLNNQMITIISPFNNY